MKKPKETPLKPLLQVLQEMNCDGRLKGQAFNFLKMDLSRLDSDDGFRKAFAGLLAAEQLLGPLHSNYQKTLDGMRKSLSVYWRAHNDMPLPAWLKEMHDIWRQTCERFRRYLPPEVWKKIEFDMVNLFKGIR